MNENCRPAARRDPRANECGGCDALELELRKRIEDVCVNRIDVQSPVNCFKDLGGRKEAIEAAENVGTTNLASGWTCTRAAQGA